MESRRWRSCYLLDHVVADITQAAEVKLTAAEHDLLALVMALSTPTKDVITLFLCLDALQAWDCIY